MSRHVCICLFVTMNLRFFFFFLRVRRCSMVPLAVPVWGKGCPSLFRFWHWWCWPPESRERERERESFKFVDKFGVNGLELTIQ